MRLIDADKLLNIIREEQKQDRPDDFKLYNIRRIVEDMESAYNIDAVVKELEEMKNNYKYAHGDCKDCRENCDAYPNDCYPCSSFEGYERYETLDKAIEIVKAGAE